MAPASRCPNTGCKRRCTCTGQWESVQPGADGGGRGMATGGAAVAYCAHIRGCCSPRANSRRGERALIDQVLGGGQFLHDRRSARRQ